MKITFLGAAHEVTGSCTLLEVNNKKILIDCGMEQGADIYENCDIPVSPSQIDCVLLTHAHIDHSGKLPMLSSNGFDGKIYTTAATHKLCRIMLLDSAHIQEFEANWRNRKAMRAGKEPYVPLYTVTDATNCLKQFYDCYYEKEYEIFDGIKIKFFDAGHLLGSASIKITFCENGVTKSILFSGDLGNINRPLIRDPQATDGADYLVIESTYGNRLHTQRPDYIAQLSQIIDSAMDKGGNLVIPSFAVGRTQELLYLIRIIKQKRLVKNPDFPVYIDSPLAVEATNIYSNDALYDFYDDETIALLNDGIKPINFNNLNLSITSEDSVAINLDTAPKVIISASGMCEAGRIRHHLKHNLWRKDCTVLFVGYQSEGTIGRLLLNGAETVKLFGEEITVNAEIKTLDGISGHADRDMMVDWIEKFSQKPSMIFVNHGSDEVCDEFASHISNTLGIKSVAPYNGSEYDLTNGAVISEGNKIRKENKNIGTANKRSQAVFEKLIAAGKRLMQVIEKNRGGANKDLSKFREQINALCDKWDK